MEKPKPNYRIRITENHNERYPHYIVRNDGGRISYYGADETPFALSNLVGAAAAELRFNLEDCADGRAALYELRRVLAPKCRPSAQPKTELLTKCGWVEKIEG